MDIANLMAEDAPQSGPLAHSAAPQGGGPQLYIDHVSAVQAGSGKRAEAMLRFATPRPHGFMEAVDAASVFHDLGKLDPDTQAALAAGRHARLHWDHIDAGVAHLTHSKAHAATWLVRGHHAPGLPSKFNHFTDGRRLRGRRGDHERTERHDEQIARTDAQLTTLTAVHAAAVHPFSPVQTRSLHGLALRLGLSCLVDADHTDTACFDSQSRPPDALPPRWAERLIHLDAHVANLPASEDAERGEHRRAFYQTCRNSPITAPMVACEGPVGLGKTTAVTAYLLHRASVENLRRIIIVAPYTNIISQTAAVLRAALTLPGEDPNQVVVEHHHRADFDSRDARDLAVTWNAPVVVTTAVQFFGTLAANQPGALRKLHALPGSAVFLDEAHAALPAHLWPQNWRWLRELSTGWGCRFVFASGSLARFWENRELIQEPQTLPELLTPDLRRSVLAAEHRRIRYEHGAHFENVDALVDAVVRRPGPRLVMLNTVQSAAVVARAMKAEHEVMHLSTALAPQDRDPVLARVVKRLNSPESDWTLVATSCVEAGVDLSFQTAFRERFSTASLIQTAGRVNRHGGLITGTVTDFVLDAGDGVTAHPAAVGSAYILKHLLQEGAFTSEDYDPAELVTRAMAKESAGLGMSLIEAELQRDYPRVAELGRVIDVDTRLVVTDLDLAERIEKRERISFRNLLMGSVQLWSPKIQTLGLSELRGRSDVFRWSYDYDPTFLGIMEGILGLTDFTQRGFMII